MSILMFSQTLSGSIALTVANHIFDSSPPNEVRRYAPGVYPRALVAAGATGIRSTVSAAQLQGVLMADSVSNDRIFCLAAGCSVLLFCASWGLGWKDV